MNVGKKKLLVSFSGGETSAFMAQWLWKHKQDEFEMIFVFANTGQENEETLFFIKKCSQSFGFPIVWLEAKINKKNRVGTSFNIVDFESASRDGKPFEDVIAKHGIPNTQTPHCTRDLKQYPIEKYAKSIGWTDYYTAIGIRIDEADRMNEKAKDKRLVYPLISMIPMTKPKINFWWSQQDFRLNLKGYEGNCKWCWKKSLAKLYTIAKENPEAFYFPAKMEAKYEQYVPVTRLKKLKERGEKPTLPTRFFRGNKSVKDILTESKHWNKKVHDDSKDYNYQSNLFDSIESMTMDELLEFQENEIDLIGGESCEVYAECG